jgi:hypothetical protein
MKSTYAALLSVIALSCAAAYGQSTTTPTAPTATTPSAHVSTIAGRKENQQDRIAQGIKSGQMTASEAATVEKQEVGINKEGAGMRAQDNGKLTAQDKATLNSQLNVESKEIYADKHNGAVQPPAKGVVNSRRENQQDRIATGLNNGSLTDHQVAKLETQESGIATEEHGMRAQDNSKLTAQDKKTLNKQLNQESRRIARDERRTQKRIK